MPNYLPIKVDLDLWFDHKLDDLPAPLKDRVKLELGPIQWDRLTAEGRRSLARQRDYEQDPGTEAHRKYWFNFYARISEKEKHLDTSKAMPAITPSEQMAKEQIISGKPPIF